MEEIQVNRKQIAIRLLYSFLFIIILSIALAFLKLAVIFQYIVLFVNKKHNENLRNLTNKVATYCYKIIRYVSLSENKRPYPFTEFPAEIEPSEENVDF